MRLASDFQRNSPDSFRNPKIVPAWHGRQEDQIWVLSDECQIDKYGHLINLEDSPYKWLTKYTGDKRLQKLESNIKLPLRRKSLAKGLEVLKAAIPGLDVETYIYICMNLT